MEEKSVLGLWTYISFHEKIVVKGGSRTRKFHATYYIFFIEIFISLIVFIILFTKMIILNFKE